MKFVIGILLIVAASIKYRVAGFTEKLSREDYDKDETNTFLVEMDEEAFDLF